MASSTYAQRRYYAITGDWLEDEHEAMELLSGLGIELMYPDDCDPSYTSMDWCDYS